MEVYDYKDGNPTPGLLQQLAKDLIPQDLWKRLGRALGITDEEIAEIDTDKREVYKKGYAVLKKWREKKVSKATYTVLAKGLLNDNIRGNRLVQKYCCNNTDT